MNNEVIDISYCQSDIDFGKVKAAGISAVIIRNGYRGKTDDRWNDHMKGASEAGLDIGTYTYIMAKTRLGAVREARETVERLEPYKGSVNYPVFCDMEDEKYLVDDYDNDKRTAIIKAFCETVRSAGYYPAVYINPDWLENKVNKTEILGKYDIWLAAWTDSRDKPTKYDYGQKMWQYGVRRVDGVRGNVDGNICYVDYPSVVRKSGMNFLKEKESDLVTITATKSVPAENVAQYAGKLSSMGFAVTAK